MCEDTQRKNESIDVFGVAEIGCSQWCLGTGFIIGGKFRGEVGESVL